MLIFVASLLFANGNDFAIKCAEPSEQRACAAYIAGVLENQSVHDALSGRPSVCLPVGISSEATVKAVIDYVMKHSDTVKRRAAEVVKTALGQKFSCKQFEDRFRPMN